MSLEMRSPLVSAGPSRLRTVSLTSRVSSHSRLRELSTRPPPPPPSFAVDIEPQDREQAQAQDPHIEILLRNPELTSTDATNELRWIRSEVRERAQNLLSKGRLPPVEDETIREMVRRRSEGEPLQYILGNTDFGPLTILCQKPVLIPRPETADIFIRLAQYINSLSPAHDTEREGISILDLCTGSGCIPLLLSHELSTNLESIVGIDNSPAAIALASANVQRLKCSNVKIRYRNIFSPPTWASNWIDDNKKVDMVVSNPPYIPYDEWETLPVSVREYESPSALLGDGPDKSGRGLKFYERIAELLPHLLSSEEEVMKKGWNGLPRVALEVGHDQAQEVQHILLQDGLISRTEIWNDQFGKQRMVVGWTGMH